MADNICASPAPATVLSVNGSNISDFLPSPYNITYNLADTPTLVSGCISFLLVLPFVLFQFPRYPIGSAAACLIGAFLMVCSGVVSQLEAYVILGSPESLRTIFLLLGMMLFSQYFEREHLIDVLLSKVLMPGLSFGRCLWRLSLVSFLLSALFTNDACCVVLTPLALKWWQAQNSDQQDYDVEILLLGIATSANIGSSATVFGNPQNALLAARTDKPEFRLSQFDLRTSLMYIGPPAVIGYILNLGMLLFCRRLLSQRQAENRRLHPLNESTRVERTASGVRTDIPLLDSAIQVDAVAKNNKECGQPGEHPVYTNQLTGGSMPKKPTCFLPADEAKLPDGNELQEAYLVKTALGGLSRRKLAFRILLGLTMLLVVALFFASTENTKFDMGLVPMGGAIVLMALDAGINRSSPAEIVRLVDWSVLLMFVGIFVWLGGLNATHIPRYVWGRMGFMSASFKGAGEVAALCTFVAVGSNIFSNVPLTVVLMEQLLPCQDQLAMVLYISWTATIAGNLTLFGSVANLIVAGKALETTGFRLTFWRYLRYGFPSTLIIGTVGVLLINAMLRVY